MTRAMGLSSLGLWSFAGFATVFALACSAADPGVEGLTRQGQKYDDGGPNPIADSGPQVDSGGTDAGGGDTSAPVTAFTGAGAYTSNQPAMSAKAIHTSKGVGTVPNQMAACLDCHKNGGSGPEFLFAGSAFADMNAAAGAPNKEIRVRSKGNGTGYIAHSDADGNFWLKPGVAGYYPALSGIRDGAKTLTMSGDVTDGNCNKCHDGNTTKVVYLQ
ncbi:hypothetical protein BH09MYX1_BH09MYX1_43830 [soil metagenome]